MVEMKFPDLKKMASFALKIKLRPTALVVNSRMSTGLNIQETIVYVYVSDVEFDEKFQVA